MLIFANNGFEGKDKSTAYTGGGAMGGSAIVYKKISLLFEREEK